MVRNCKDFSRCFVGEFGHINCTYCKYRRMKKCFERKNWYQQYFEALDSEPDSWFFGCRTEKHCRSVKILSVKLRLCSVANTYRKHIESNCKWQCNRKTILMMDHLRESEWQIEKMLRKSSSEFRIKVQDGCCVRGIQQTKGLKSDVIFGSFSQMNESRARIKDTAMQTVNWILAAQLLNVEIWLLAWETNCSITVICGLWNGQEGWDSGDKNLWCWNRNFIEDSQPCVFFFNVLVTFFFTKFFFNFESES